MIVKDTILKFDFGKKGFTKMVYVSLLCALGILTAGIIFIIDFLNV